MSFRHMLPIAMLFVRCCGRGASHNPREHASPEDIEIAAQVPRDFVCDPAAMDRLRRSVTHAVNTGDIHRKFCGE